MGPVAWKKKKSCKVLSEEGIEIRKTPVGCLEQVCRTKNVLYIHARLGISNWSNTTWEDFRKSSWFLDGCDDASDRSYCDIYAKIVYLNDSLLSLSRPDDSFEMNGTAYTGNTL